MTFLATCERNGETLTVSSQTITGLLAELNPKLTYADGYRVFKIARGLKHDITNNFQLCQTEPRSVAKSPSLFYRVPAKKFLVLKPCNRRRSTGYPTK